MSMDRSSAPLIDPRFAVQEIIARYPATAVVFIAHGIDPDRGGARPLREVAERSGVELWELQIELTRAVTPREWGLGGRDSELSDARP